MASETEQKDGHPPQIEAEQTAAVPKTLLQRAGAQVKNWFTGDNLFGSATIAAYLYPQLKLISGGKHRRDTEGRAAEDKWRIRSNQIDIASGASLFASSRGAKAPEGKNMFERMKYTLMHPNSSAVYFYRLTQIPVELTSVVSNLEKGVAAMKKGGKKAERVRLLSAAITTLSSGFYIAGMFDSSNKVKNFPEEDGKQEKPTTAKEAKLAEKAKKASGGINFLYPYYVVKFAFQRYPKLVAAVIFDILIDASLMVEAYMVNKNAAPGQKKSATELTKAAVTNITLDTSLNYYSWVQMLKDARATSASVESTKTMQK